MASKARIKAKQKERCDLHRATLAAIKVERGCADCGYSEHACALDFDHVEDKSFNIGMSISSSLKRLLSEVAKCEVVCSNCHRVRTHARRD